MDLRQQDRKRPAEDSDSDSSDTKKHLLDDTDSSSSEMVPKTKKMKIDPLIVDKDDTNVENPLIVDDTNVEMLGREVNALLIRKRTLTDEEEQMKRRHREMQQKVEQLEEQMTTEREDMKRKKLDVECKLRAKRARMDKLKSESSGEISPKQETDKAAFKDDEEDSNE